MQSRNRQSTELIETTRERNVVFKKTLSFPNARVQTPLCALVEFKYNGREMNLKSEYEMQMHAGVFRFVGSFPNVVGRERG